MTASRVLIILTCLAMSGALEGLAAKFISPDWQNRVALGLSVIVLIGAVAAIYFRLLQRRRIYVFRFLPHILFMVFIVLSVQWTVNREATLQSVLLTAAPLFAAVAFSQMFQWKDICIGLAMACTLLGLLTIVTIPFGGTMTEIYPGAVTGPWLEKNRPALVFAIGTIACFSAVYLQKNYFWAAPGLMLAGLIVFTQSMSAALAMATGVGWLIFIEFFRPGPYRIIGIWIATAVVAPIFIFLALNPNLIIESVGRDATLTGRTEIWQVVLSRIQQQPLFGYGYGSFWEETNAHFDSVMTAIGFRAFNAHNAWLEVFLGLGLIGGVLFSLFWLRALWSCFIANFSSSDSLRFALPVLITMLIHSFMESLVSGPDDLAWMILLVIAGQQRLKQEKAAPFMPRFSTAYEHPSALTRVIPQ